MTALRKPDKDRIVQMCRTALRFQEARRVWNLRRREERRAFLAQACLPRVDYGEEPALRPGFHVEGDKGWMD